MANETQTPTDPTTVTDNSMGQLYLSQLITAHDTYGALFDRVYPSVDKLPRIKAWADNLPTVETPESLSYAEMLESARLSADAATVATIRRMALALADKAWENLQGIHAVANSTRTPLVGTADAAGVEAARLQLASFLKMAPQMAAAGCIPEGSEWTFLPSRTTDGGRTVYNGPSLPTSRKVSVLRANTKRIVIVVDGNAVGSAERDLKANVAEILHLDMAELKTLVGDFTSDNYGQEFTSPANGVTFKLELRADAEPEPEDDDNDNDDN